MSRIIKMVDEIKEYYYLNDTLLARDLGIMQQTIKGWREGRKPNLDNYNKVKKMYEEMKREAVDNSIMQRFEALEEKVEKKQPYRVEVPENIGDYYTLDDWGEIYDFEGFTIEYAEHRYRSGLAFKTVEEAKKYYKERELLFKLHKWAEEHNGGWIPNWRNFDENKHSVTYDYDENRFRIKSSWYETAFSKLPCFISYDIAEQFVEEFKEEIIEVLC